MRVLHVVPTYLPATRYGGPIYSVHALCRALAARGHDVHVFTTNVDGPSVSPVRLGEPVALEGVTVWYFRTEFGRRLYRSPEMGRVLNQYVADFDLLHLHSVFLWPTTAAASAARRARVPYVLAPRGMLVGDLIQRKSRLVKSAWIKLFERRNIAAAAAVHVTAELEAEEFEKLGLPTKRVAIVPNGIEMPLAPVHGLETGLADTLPRPMVLSLGRINWKKGLDRLIAAMAYVPTAHLVIAGNDEEGYQPQLEAMAHQCGVADRTHFLGPVHGSRKWQLLANTDVFAMPSHSENFGIAVLEAMASCTPVVVTPGVGLADVVSASGAGLVVDGDPVKIAKAISSLLANPEKRRRMGEAGRRLAAERFSWEKIGQSMEALYLDICTGVGTG